MITGVRLTQLSNGEPLLGDVWYYNEDQDTSQLDQTTRKIISVEKRLEDLFKSAKSLGFNFVIDKIKPVLDTDMNLTVSGVGLYNNIWSFERRIELYEKHCKDLNLQLLAEIEFPTDITESNWQKYADYFIKLVNNYEWIDYWQVMTLPESPGNNGNEYICDPIVYNKFIKYVYPRIKFIYSGKKIGGPAVFQSLIDFVNGDIDCWLSVAIGNKYGLNSKYDDIGSTGFLNYIDFFAIQGKQNTSDLNYTDNFAKAIGILNANIYNKLFSSLPIFSTYQGWQAAANDTEALNRQGYQELREFLNCMQNGVVPFKNQLIDEYFINGVNGPNPLLADYGLMEYTVKDVKPAYAEYNFLLNNLNDFNTIVEDNKDIYEDNTSVQSMSFMKEDTINDKKIIATVIWPIKYGTCTVTLRPHFARTYLTISNTMQQDLLNSTQILLDKSHFIIVYEIITNDTIEMTELQDLIDKKLTLAEETLISFMNLLPDTYNKEISDTNYYKLLRSLAFEIADAKIEIERVKDNSYLDTAKDDAIYNNFGILVNLTKRQEWDNEEYRKLVQGVTKSLLEGPNPKSIVNALSLFTNFNVNVYELYKQYNNIDLSGFNNSDTQFTFVVEIEKTIGENMNKNMTSNEDQMAIYRDANYIINIVKPAHTISIILVTLVDSEDYIKNYENKYGIKFENSDSIIDPKNPALNSFSSSIENTEREGVYGWKGNYSGNFNTLKIDDNGIYENSALTNGGIFIGPRYVLYDQSEMNVTLTNNDVYDRNIEEIITNLLSKSFYEDSYLKQKNIVDTVQGTIDYSFRETKYRVSNDSNMFRFNSNRLNMSKLSYCDKMSDEERLEMVISLLEDRYNSQINIIDNLKADIGYSEINPIPEDNYEHVANLSESFKTYKLGDILYHSHKKVTVIANDDNFNVYLPNNDLFLRKDNYFSSFTKVYVNGWLLPEWCYDESPAPMDNSRSNMISFTTGVVNYGDIVTLLYLKDRELVIESNLIKSEEQTSYIVFDLEEITNWRFQKFYTSSKFVLNKSALNIQSILPGQVQDTCKMELYKIMPDGSTTYLQ